MNEKEYEKHALHGWQICEDVFAYVILFPFTVLGYITQNKKATRKPRTVGLEKGCPETLVSGKERD